MKQRKRVLTRRRWVAALAAVALLAAACGGDDEVTYDTQPASTDGASGTNDARVVVPAGEAIQIRSLNTISGEVAYLGLPIQHAVEQAIADYGSVRGFDVDMGTGLDDLCSPEGGQAAAQLITADEQVVGVIGTSCSSAAAAAAPVISGANMVIISGANSAPSLTSDLAGNAGADHVDGYFRTSHNDLVQGAAMAHFVYDKLKLTTAAAMHDGDPYTVGLSQSFGEAFTALGGTVTGTVGIAKEDTDMTPALTELAAGSPEAVFFPIFQPAGDYVADQVRSVEGMEDVVRLGADALLVDSYLELPQTKGMFFSGPDVRFGQNRNQATGVSAEEFLATYQARYGETPTSPFWAHGYDATTLLLDAIATASEVVEGDLVIDRAAVRQALADTADYDGILGSLTCDDYGDCGPAKIAIIHNTGDDIALAKENIVYSFAR